jgi:transposase InsO family protein
VRYAWIERHRDEYTIARMCQHLDVSRTGYLKWRKRAPSDRAIANAALDAQVAAIHAQARRSYGRPRIVRVLHANGVAVGHERVRQSLLRQALRPVYRKPYRVTTDSAHMKPVAANVLNRRFAGWQINRAWLADLTYIRTDEGWLYLACILDLGSRRVVGWSLSERMKTQLVCDALTMAYWRRKPPAGLIMHSDRGVQYAADEHRKLIAQYRMVQSMSRKGNCWDNAPMESFFKTLKVEWVDRMRYTTRAQARLDVIDWIEGFYNAQRVHSSIEYQSPSSFEKHLHAA